MVTDANGCEAFKDGFIGPVGADVPCLTAIPVITPNEDGYNDYLDIYCLELYPQNKLEVFNRYGQVVFEQSNYVNRTWTPRDASGNPLPDGGYFYVIQVFEVVGTPGKQKGSFNIVSEK
jgi:gliding motility-associated-like protein